MTPFRMATAALVFASLFVFTGADRGGLRAAQTPAARQPAPRGGSLNPAPPRRANEGQGPFKTLVIRGAILIDGTGAPPVGPVDIVVEQNRIRAIRSAGTPGVPPRPNRPPDKPEHEIDATGMYVLPGFVDTHVHAGGAPKNPDAEYPYKLWLAHGVTTVRGVSLADNPTTVSDKARGARNEIVAPRIVNYQRPGTGWDKGPIETPEAAREWVRWAAANGVDGLKLGAHRPEIMGALIDEAKKHGLGTTAHLQQTGVAQMNALDAAKLGLGTVTHFYGHFEALLKDYVVQPWPVDQINDDEQMRFGQVARLWDQIYPPGSDEWKAYLQAHVKLGTVFDPTMTAYAAGRHVMALRNADWHERYTLPSLMDFYVPNRTNHGAYFYDWTTADEVAWRNFFQVWFRLLNDYKKMGGRVTVGSDAGFIYNTYGFGYVHEMELLQEAGFHPLEVIQAATYNGALTLHEPAGKTIEYGVVRPGLLADMVIVDQNPLRNLKVLYGTGAVKLNDQTGRPERIGGVKYTIKDGIVYDAKQLLADVAAMVEKQKRSRRDTTTSASIRE
ncbi:MAG TPA: amidohydrolase family protein [Vicinamibacterales bacterium]|nr:amidohydrolase family protein [Vicinamibacterales bacterium]